MSSPATFGFRLPSEAEARTILKNAGTAEGAKAKRNLYKSLDWAYKGLSDEAKQAADRLRPTLQAELTNAIAKNATPNDAATISILLALLAVSPALAHPGGNRDQPLNPAQTLAVNAAIASFKLHLDEIQLGTHDNLINRLFPPDPHTRDDAQARLTDVKTAFRLAYERALALSKTKNGILVDAYLSAMKAAGLGNPNCIKLELKFFGYDPGEQEAVVAHESTHTIQDAQYVTNDDGGYIGSHKFKTSTLAERKKNASHFEAVIRLINEEDLEDAGDDPTGEVQAAKETVRKAWTKAINLYGELQKYHNQLLPLTANESEYVKAVAQLFGLPAYKQPEGTVYSVFGTRITTAPANISQSDLAFAENRVGKLGVLLATVERAAATLDAQDVSIDNILLKLVEMEGTIRKTTNHQKTVDMIKTLADFSQQSVTTFMRTIY